MSKKFLYGIFLSFISVFAPLLTNSLYASPYPDAGNLYREFKDDSSGRQSPKPNTKSSPMEQTSQSTTGLESSQPIPVEGFEIHGNTQLTAKEIQSTLESFTKTRLTSSQLHKAADTLRDTYVRNGLFAAQVIIPTQSVENGIVMLYVYEGRLAQDGLFTQNSENRVKNDVIHNILQHNLNPGEVIRTNNIERSMLLVNDLPGISSRSTLYPGSEVGTANFLLQTSDDPLISGNVDIDNFGGYFSGEARLGTTVYVNSPSKMGDQITTRFVTSGSRSNYAFLQYERPVGGNGLYLGASLDYLDYSLGKEFKQLDAHGNASEFQLLGHFPLVRSRHTNVHSTVRLFNLSLKDNNNTDFTSERSIPGVQIRLQGDHDDDMWASGISYYSVSITLGNVSIESNDLYQAFDEQFSKTKGEYAKFEFSVARLQHITGGLSGYLNLNGQFANSNLDTSQKFYIGGPYNVAGYPIGEASGDDGALIYGDLRYDIFNVLWQGNLQLAAFYSEGWTKIYHDPWVGWQGTNDQIENKIILKSFGFSAHQTWQDQLLIRLIVGKQVGKNLGSDPVTSEDSDFSDNEYRVWAQGVYYF